MTLTLKRYGRYTSGSPESDTGIITPAGASRACVFDANPVNVWWIKGGFVGGKVSGNASARISVYEADGSKNPDERVGYMANVTVSTIMVGGGDGTHYTADVSVSDNGPTNDAILGYSGRRYAIDIIAGTNPMRHSMVPASAISADNEQFYNRASPSNPPPSSYGVYSASVEGHLTAYLEGWQNEAPFAPSAGLAPTGTVTETAPTFEADFKDLNGSWGDTSGDGVDTGDQLNQYRIQLRAVGSTTLLWDTPYNATGAEKAADAVSRGYGGSSLTRGVAYEWRMKWSDTFGAHSDWSDWTQFTPASLGFVTLDSDPTGTIQENTPDFKGRWNHQTAADMTRVQVRIRNSAGIILQTGADYNIADVASSALPGTLFTIPWANTGLTDLPWGANLRYEIRGKDATTWSDWSAQRAFKTNAAPTIPTLTSPASGIITTAYPVLQGMFVDSDDTVATGLTGVMRITRPDASTVDVTPTYNPATGLWSFPTTGTQISMVGTYSWKFTGYDGTLYSGESTTLGAATWSSSRTFTYGIGPTVTITSPADLDTITTAALTVEWTVTGQVKYQVIVYADGTSDIVYDSGLITSASLSHAIPSGYLRNSTSYDLVVSSMNATPLTGTSDIVNIDVAFTPADSVENFQVNPVSIGLDPWDTALRLTWDQTAYSAPEFVEYTIFRQADGGADSTQVILTRITSPGTTQFVDYTPASGYEYTYGITVSIVTGVDTLESDVVEGMGTVTLLGTVLTLVGNAGTYRAALLNVREREFDRQHQEAVYQSPASTKPITVRALTRYWDGSYEGALVTDESATFLQRWDEFNALDAQNSVVCIRDQYRRKDFCMIADLKQVDEMPDWISYQFSLRGEQFSEGEV